MGWGGTWEGGSGWGTHVHPWLIHVNVWQKPLQYCKVISIQLIKINEKKIVLMSDDSTSSFMEVLRTNLKCTGAYTILNLLLPYHFVLFKSKESPMGSFVILLATT